MLISDRWTNAPSPLPFPERIAENRSRIKQLAALILTWTVCLLLPLTIIAGGLVAGLHAGLDYNSFPLMNGQVVPQGYARLTPFWRNLVENIPTVQFNHRVLATVTTTAALAAAIAGLRHSARPERVFWLALGGAAALQYALGIAVLLTVVPIGLAIGHQACAVLLLTTALVVLHRQSGRA